MILQIVFNWGNREMVWDVMDHQNHDSAGWDCDASTAVAPPSDVGAAIGSDERRMHVRAYNHWCSLLDGRDYPSIADLDPGEIQDFGPNSVLLDFGHDIQQPLTPYIGSAIREECDLAADGVQSICDVPTRSLLSRLTGHYMEIIANRAPVGFEAEFVNQRSRTISYRGILMPFSSDGMTIDFIYGVINWKDKGSSDVPLAVLRPVLPPLADEEPDEEEDDVLYLTDRVADDGQSVELDTPRSTAAPATPHLIWEDGPLGRAADAELLDLAAPVLEPDAGLADRLCAARESAEVCKQADGRSRVALYRALAMAHDFAVAARRVPDDYAEILADAGVKVQARAPMTPIVKLVFGADYDKTRVTEFAAALANAERENIDFGGFQAFVEAADGGLKGLVAAERKARRPVVDGDDKAVTARVALRRAPAIALSHLPTNEEFALVVTRRNADGVHEVVRLVDDHALLDRVIRRLA